MPLWFVHEEFTDEERARLAPHFTNLDGPVFALLNLPEVVKGALFARYSRTGKSLRRLFLDEFAEQVEGTVPFGTGGVKVDKAEQLYERVFFDFGDDSVAQLGGVHLACEQVSQPLAKAIEWGRLAAYLEQSTRYMRYDDRPGGRWRLTVPPETSGTPAEDAYLAFADRTFETYGRLFQPLFDLFAGRFPKEPGDSEFLYRSTITAKTCDTLRELLPAGTRSNLGVYATGQSYEQMLLRMRAHPLAEVREYADLMLVELRTVIPAFLKRVDLEDRGVAWSRYLADTRNSTDEVATKFTGGAEPEPRELVTLTDFDPLGEEKVVAAALYAATDLPDDQVRGLAHAMSADEREAVLRAYVGDRANRRHKPGRAFERTDYRFDVLCDFGAFRDLQRHRPLTLEWQTLTPAHGFDTPQVIARGRDDGGVGRRHAGLGVHMGDPRRARGRGGGAVRRRDGLPDPVRDADERSRGDPPDRAAFLATGTPDVPARGPAHARADRAGGRPPGDRRGDVLPGHERRGPRAARGRTASGRETPGRTGRLGDRPRVVAGQPPGRRGTIS